LIAIKLLIRKKTMLFVVAAALVDSDGRVLLTTRPAGKPMAGLWEFPGGKVHEKETPEAALVRELKEELGITTSADCLWPLAFATHPLNYASGQPDQDWRDCGGCNPLAPARRLDPEDQLLLLLYTCRRWEGIPHPHEGQEMKWIRPVEMSALPMPPADRPLAARLREAL
jgi:8-oxo-dGTP diphosphatase